MIKAIAVDDEINALGIIQEFCSKTADIELKASFTNPLLIHAYCKNNPDIELVFLDIQMSQLNGLKLAESLSSLNIKIILTTAYPNYAFEGFELDAIDYLLKPISFERFERSLNKYKTSNHQLTSTFKQQADSLEKKETSIFVRSNFRNIKINLSEIHYIEGSKNYVKIHTSKKTIMSLLNMKNIEEMLKPHQFIRVHKSYIIPFHLIEMTGKDFLKVGKTNIPIGESYKDSFTTFLKENSWQI